MHATVTLFSLAVQVLRKGRFGEANEEMTLEGGLKKEAGSLGTPLLAVGGGARLHCNLSSAELGPVKQVTPARTKVHNVIIMKMVI